MVHHLYPFSLYRLDRYFHIWNLYFPSPSTVHASQHLCIHHPQTLLISMRSCILRDPWPYTGVHSPHYNIPFISQGGFPLPGQKREFLATGQGEVVLYQQISGVGYTLISTELYESMHYSYPYSRYPSSSSASTPTNSQVLAEPFLPLISSFSPLLKPSLNPNVRLCAYPS